ncbi:MAG TPA: ATP-binding cassette domain-containing protein [Burkholderiales bacterium]|nr:ATP-binding cassette domain-containing protein [Burkholderiales bacterium]
MIFLREVALRRGARLLFAHASVTFFRGQKVGVTGANGVGKSSLFALLAGELHPDSGQLELQPGIVIARLLQELPPSRCPAIEFVLDGDAELRSLQTGIAQAEASGDGLRLAELHEGLAKIGGYAARARAAQLMHGLGFREHDLARPVDDFSGGWRVRLNLARALMCRSDLLLLDEPTNHLDLDAIVWLESWLRSFPGTLLLISHDRDFLDATVRSICHIEDGALRLYEGNYSAFERQRAERLAGRRAAYDKQQREIARTRAFIERFRAKATKARQAQSRLKALARLDRIAPAHVDAPFEFSFRAAPAQPDPAIVIDAATVGYGGEPVLREVDFALRAGARIGLLGRNGAGKSTLVKLLAAELVPLKGARVEGKGVAIGYFAQHQLDQLRPDESALAHLMRADPAAREQELRDFLGGFDFRADMALTPVGRFSGGEKSRLALALIAWRRPNVLLLDEPTNHLDLEMRYALLRALQEFAGAMVLVSHDRHLLRAACDELYLVADGTVREFPGDVDDYAQQLQSVPEQPAGVGHVTPGRRERRREEAWVRERRSARRRPLQERIRTLEEQMVRLAADKARLEKRLATPDLYGEACKEELKQCLLQQARVSRQLQEVEEHWLELNLQLESVQ